MADWIDREIAANRARAKERGKAANASFPHATAVAYSADHNLVVIDLENGAKFAFPPNIAQGLENASAEQLARVEVTPGGHGLLWPEIDAALSVQGVLSGIFGSKAWAKDFASRGGRSQSSAKVSAARTNGAKGGRPRKRALSG